MSTIMQDVRFALRTLRQTPMFAALAIITIALGVGANTAVFSMVNGVLLRRLPYGGDKQLVVLHQPSATQPDARFSISEVEDYRRQVSEFAAVSEYHSMPFDLYGRGEPTRVVTGVVSDNFFDLLGVRPVLGRVFKPGEDAIGAEPVLVLSYRFWMTQLGGDPNIIGARFTMNDHIHTVVGVLPPLPPYPDANDVWMPASACPFRSAPATLTNRNARLSSLIAVMKNGVTVEQARSSIGVVASRLKSAYPDAYPARARLETTVARLSDELTQQSRPLFLTLLITAFFVLVVAAANFASLTLSRQLRRAREMSLRSALGASRGRLFRQLVTENLCVSVAGGLLGVGVAYVSLGMLRTMAARVTPRADEISLDPVVLGFAIVLSVIVGVIAAVLPLRSGAEAQFMSLRSGGTTATTGRGDGRARGLLVTCQVAVAFVVLIGAGLLTRSMIALQRTDGGYDVDHVMTASVSLNWSRYTTRVSRLDFADRLRQRLAAEPGVLAAAVATDFPLNSPAPSAQPFLIRSRPVANDQTPTTSDVTVVSPDYFRAIGVRVLRGRSFTEADRDTANAPAMISQGLAERHWKSAEVLGEQISLNNGRNWLTIVGVVSDVRQNNIAAGISDQIYAPAAIFPSGVLRVLVRTSGDPAAIGPRIRAAVRELDANQPIYAVQTLETLRGVSLAQPRETAALISFFAALSLIITAGGLAGVVGYAVSQRVNEIGVRVALGASPKDVIGVVVRGASVVVALGLVIGAGASLGLARFLQGLLYEVRPTDPVTFAGVGVALVAIAATACWIPARRALKISPIEALRAR